MFGIRAVSVAMLLCFMALLQGCAGFRGNNIAHINPADMKAESAKPLKVFSRWSIQSTRAMNENIRVAAAAIHKKNFEAALALSACCVSVDSLDQADIVVDGVAHDESNPAAMIPAFITGFSLFTIPSWATIKVHVTANAQKGGASYSYDVSDSMTMVQWLPLIFALPFANPMSVAKDVDSNTYNALVMKMRQDGVL